MEPDYIRAHEHCALHREELYRSDTCGCFYCCRTFGPQEIEDWIDASDGVGMTALCPRCGIDSVIGSASGFPITEDFLGLMQAHWFSLR